MLIGSSVLLIFYGFLLLTMLVEKVIKLVMSICPSISTPAFEH